MSLHKAMAELLAEATACEEPLTKEEYEVFNSRPFKLLCWHFDQLRKGMDQLRDDQERTQDDVNRIIRGPE